MSNKYLELLDLPTFKENIVKKIQDLLEEHKDNTRHVPDGGNPANFLGLNEEGVPAWIELNKSWFVTYTGDTTTSVDLSEQFMDEWSYGVEFPEGTISTPNKLTRIGKSEYHKTLPIQSNLRGCVEQNGVVQYYLNEKDWTADTKDFDGNVITPRLDGYDGDVAIDTLRDFYINFRVVTKTDGVKYRQVRISYTKFNDNWIKVPRKLLHAFRASRLREIPSDMGWLSKQSVNTLVSVCNTGTYLRGGKYDNDTTQITWDEYLESNPAKCMLGKPVSYISMSTGRIGLGYTDHHIMSYSEYTYIICWLYIIEYASFYSQETYNSQSTTDGYKQGGLGAGVTDLSSTNWSNLNSYYPVTPNGYTNDLGNGTGIKALKYTVSDKEYTTYVCRWRGFENPFGDTWQFVDGVMCHKNAVTTDSTTTYPTSTWYICDDPTYFTSSTNLSAYDNIYWRKVECPINSSGWPNNFFFGSDPTPDSSNDQITIGGWFGDLIPISLGGSASTGTTDYFYTSNNVFCCLIFGGYARSGTDAGLLYFDVLSSLDLVHTHVVIRGAINPKSSS